MTLAWPDWRRRSWPTGVFRFRLPLTWRDHSESVKRGRQKVDVPTQPATVVTGADIGNRHFQTRVADNATDGPRRGAMYRDSSSWLVAMSRSAAEL